MSVLDEGLPNGLWLARACAQRPSLVAAVESVIGDPYGDRRVPCGWQDWHAGLQLLEHAARHGRQVFTGADYRWAGAWLEAASPGEVGGLDAGRAGQVARLLRGLGSYAEDQHACRLSWEQRYASRVPTAEELTADLEVRDGRVRVGRWLPGFDGGRYALGVRDSTGMAGSRPVVVVTNSAGGSEVVRFADDRIARGWLAGRLRGASGAIAVGGPGAGCRAAGEDELLGWLIHAAYGEVPWDQLAAVRWTTHLRAELFLALVPDGKERPTLNPGSSPASRIRGQLARRLAFAPGWAVAEGIGWPGARGALAYFDRLAAAAGTESHALGVASWLACADAQAAEREAPDGHVAVPAAAVTQGPVRITATGTRRLGVGARVQRTPLAAGPARAQQPPQRRGDARQGRVQR